MGGEFLILEYLGPTQTNASSSAVCVATFRSSLFRSALRSEAK